MIEILGFLKKKICEDMAALRKPQFQLANATLGSKLK
jgi:hypothetical protein